MRIFLFFLLVPLFAFALDSDWCLIVCDDWSGNDTDTMSTACHLTCDSGTEPPTPSDIIPMDKETCHALQETTTRDLNDVISSLFSFSNQVDQLIYGLSNQFYFFDAYFIQDLYDQVAALCAVTNANFYVCENPEFLRDEFERVVPFVTSDLTSIIHDTSSLIDRCERGVVEITRYECKDSQCTGTGDGSTALSCPCTTEFNEILSKMQLSYDQVTELYRRFLESKSTLDNIASNLVSLTFIVDRAKAPDDRMFEELTALWTDYAASEYASNIFQSVNLSGIFHDLKAMIRGDTGTQLNLTTEGVISLYSAFFDMLNNQALTQTSSYIQDAYQQMSNLVSRFFTLFNNRISNWGRQFPVAQVYAAFTNDNMSGYSRMTKLVNEAHHTNWFSRVELYLQSLNGWYSQNFVLDAENDLERVTESSITHSIDEATNGFSVVGREIDSITNFVNSSSSSVFSLIDELSVSASEPSVLTVLPEIQTVGNMSFGPWQIDTSQDPWNTVIPSVRNLTSFFWRGAFLVLVLGVCYLAFRLVAFVGGWLMLLIKGM